MKFSCDSSLLFKSINIVEKAIAQKSTISVLENICFELSESKLILRANDLEIGIEHAIDVMVDPTHSIFPTSVLIKGKTISGIFSKISPQIIQITVDENNRFKIVGKGVNYDIMGIVEADINGDAEVNSNSRSAGQGTTARSERIDLSIAAMVTRVMPNGYLLIEGSQEVVVNFEQRTLHVSGLIRPADISPENTISYEKVAEARIAYGGTGRITEVQQPGWGQQIWDRVSPF